MTTPRERRLRALLEREARERAAGLPLTPAQQRRLRRDLQQLAAHFQLSPEATQRLLAAATPPPGGPPGTKENDAHCRQ